MTLEISRGYMNSDRDQLNKAAIVVNQMAYLFTVLGNFAFAVARGLELWRSKNSDCAYSNSRRLISFCSVEAWM